MTFPIKLGSALVLGVAVGASTHWLLGAVVFAVGATAITAMQLRAEVSELREMVGEEEEIAPPSSAIHEKRELEERHAM
jgi:hypothetical protein